MLNLKKVVSNTKSSIKKRINKLTGDNKLNHRKTKKRSALAKRYASRPSPNTSATLYKIGTIKTGNDGNKYIVINTQGKSRKIKRWVRHNSNKNSRNNKLKRTKVNKKMSKKQSGGNCRISLGQEVGFNVNDTGFVGLDGTPPIKGIKIGSSKFKIGQTCNSSNSGHAMIV